MTDWLGVRIMYLYGSTCIHDLVIQLGRTMKTIQLPVYVWYKAVYFRHTLVYYFAMLEIGNKRWRIPKGQSKTDNPVKLVI